jgi:hypothetical protein
LFHREIDYEKVDIDITEYSNGIIIGLLLFTIPEKNARGIYVEYIMSACRSVRFINDKGKLITAENNFEKQSRV